MVALRCKSPPQIATYNIKLRNRAANYKPLMKKKKKATRKEQNITKTLKPQPQSRKHKQH